MAPISGSYIPIIQGEPPAGMLYIGSAEPATSRWDSGPSAGEAPVPHLRGAQYGARAPAICLAGG
jgi:hypothetical protein